MNQQGFPCCHNFLTVIPNYHSKVTPISGFHAEKIAKAVLCQLGSTPSECLTYTVEPPPPGRPHRNPLLTASRTVLARDKSEEGGQEQEARGMILVCK